MVDRALGAASRGLKKTIKQINRDAGKLLARGDYERADEAVKVARALAAFGAELADVDRKWHAASDSIVSTGKLNKVPLWTQYKPILSALAEIGGEASRTQLAAHLSKSAVALPSTTLARARSAMVAEGFLDGSTKGVWKITEAGRKAAKT